MKSFGHQARIAAIQLALLAWALTAAAGDRFFTGSLLVATSEIRDPRFAETVIYLVKHDASGAFGLVINKPMGKVSYQELLKGFGTDSASGKGDVVLHYGGPVGANEGFVLHSDETTLDSSTKVKDGIAMTADARMVQAMSQNKGARQALFMFGYTGWAPGQLEGELRANSWFIIPGDKNLIFGKDAEKKWRQANDRRQIPS